MKRKVRIYKPQNNTNLSSFQEGGIMNEEIIMKIQEALQKGISPEQLLEQLQRNGVPQEQAIAMIQAAMPQEQMQSQEQMQYGGATVTTRHNYLSDLNYTDGVMGAVNKTALQANNLSDPRNLAWALPDTGLGSGLKAVTGLASGLAGSYLGYAKAFNKDKISVADPTEKPMVTHEVTPNDFKGNLNAVEVKTNPISGVDIWDWDTQHPNLTAENNYNQTSIDKENTLNDRYNAPGQNSIGPINAYKNGGLKKYQNGDQKFSDNNYDDSSYQGYDQLSIEEQLIPDYNNINFPNNVSQPDFSRTPWLKQYSQYPTGPKPPKQYPFGNIPDKMQTINLQQYANYFPGVVIDEGGTSMDNYQNRNNVPNNIYNQNPSNKTEEQLKKEQEYLAARGDDIGFVAANNALLGFQNFNDVMSAKNYEKEYNDRLITTGNTMNRMNSNNPVNPYGTYTPNAGIGSNYGLVANSPIQDFGTKLASAKCGGQKKYQEGGEYNLTQEEIDFIIKNGGEIEIID